MIDLHCHILPAVDDGSDSMNTSILMAAMAADDGISRIIATPHITWNNGSNIEHSKRIINAMKEFSSVLNKEKIPISCYLGAEVLCVSIQEQDLREYGFPLLNNTKYSLVEFYFDESEKDITEKLRVLHACGIIPIIAHPERYEAVQKNKKVLYKWKDMGCLLQINKGSIVGDFGRKAQKLVNWALKETLIDIVASDAHGTRTRTTRMKSVFNEVVRKYGYEYAEKLFVTNPLTVLEDGLLY